jgi:GcrA cell cycle regulator
MPFAWSSAALNDLHRLYIGEKRSAAQTARALGGGVTRNAVLGKVQRLGWTRTDGPKAGRIPRPAEFKPVRAPRRLVRSGGPFSRVLPLPKLREISVVGTPTLWTERRAGQCAFPVGEPTEPGRQYACCAPAAGRSAYCPAHRALMTVEGTALTPKDQAAIAEIARRAA